MNLLSQIEHWRRYWQTARDVDDVERNLRKLRWLEGFAFHSKGNAVTAVMFRALVEQIAAAGAKLRELRSDDEGPGQNSACENIPARTEFPRFQANSYAEHQTTVSATQEQALA